ncbi:energy-coupling factor transporter transmembrane component T [Streptomyces sp. SLBN-118]|uniref:energy-coupling factor transporter transmembrane component T n=1 Tax=Streptomyces sp. SLBN-118 TaxID=2768454 RepID=UPI0037DA0552
MPPTPRSRARKGPGSRTLRSARTADAEPRHPRRPRLRAPEADRSNALHAGAWWLWALGLAVAASRTTNPLLLGLIVGVAGYVVAARRTDAPWARSYGAFVKLGLVVIAVRVLFSVVLGSPIPGTHTLLTLPEVPLPDWAKGIRVGGRVSAEQLVFALYDGAKLATLLICVGAANALANPARLLKSLPGALYEAGVAVVVAMTFAPNMVADIVRLRTARRLRGRPTGGIKALVQIGLPVLEGALERSVAVAASMDARGYGRSAQVPPAVRHTTTALTLGGLLGVCAGSYGLLDPTSLAYGVPLLVAGLAAAAGGLWLGGRRSVRTRYRPDRWGLRAWLVAGSGAAVALLMIRANAYDPEALHPGVVPLTAPTLPLWPAMGIMIGLLPAFVAPAPAQPSQLSQEKP